MTYPIVSDLISRLLGQRREQATSPLKLYNPWTALEWRLGEATTSKGSRHDFGLSFHLKKLSKQILFHGEDELGLCLDGVVALPLTSIYIYLPFFSPIDVIKLSLFVLFCLRMVLLVMVMFMTSIDFCCQIILV